MLQRPVESALAALVRMVNHGSRLARMQCHVQRHDHQIGRHLYPKGPTHHLATVYVSDHRQIQEPLPSRYIGHVRYPELVHILGHKLPFHQVRRRSLAFVAFARHAPCAPATDPLDVHRPHQRGNTFTAGMNPCIGQLGANAGHTVCLIAGLVGLNNALTQTHVGFGTLGSMDDRASRSSRWWKP